MSGVLFKGCYGNRVLSNKCGRQEIFCRNTPLHNPWIAPGEQRLAIPSVPKWGSCWNWHKNLHAVLKIIAIRRHVCVWGGWCILRDSIGAWKSGLLSKCNLTLHTSLAWKHFCVQWADDLNAAWQVVFIKNFLCLASGLADCLHVMLESGQHFLTL